MSFGRVLVANRGEIAVRIVRACHGLGLEAVVVASEADRDGLAAQMADRTVCIGPAQPAASYLNHQAIVATALATGAGAVHPGYGFLAEDPKLAELCEQEGLVLVGPAATTIRQMGDKVTARAAARRAGLPTVPGCDELSTADDACEAAHDIGYPVLLKAAAGGGGTGIRMVERAEDMSAAFDNATVEAAAAFGNGALFLERCVTDARHVEVQVLGDHRGGIIHLGDRDCSLQRRRQKVVEEAPASAVPAHLRRAMTDGAVALAREIGYRNAGTVEFVVDTERGDHYFLEMNTRIQVEHPVTEAVTGIDLVEAQLTIANEAGLPCGQDDVVVRGHAIECRITAETASGFRPEPGPHRPVVTSTDQAHVRVDTHCYEGCVVPPHYDSLLAKLVVWGADRDAALDRTREALAAFEVGGTETTLDFLRHVLDHDDLRAGRVSTTWLEEENRAFSGTGTVGGRPR